jgi:hypothetical protein
LNVERLKEYRSRLVVFPRKAGKPKNGDAQVGTQKGKIDDRVTTLLLTLPELSPVSHRSTSQKLPVLLRATRRRQPHSGHCVRPGLDRGARVPGRRDSPLRLLRSKLADSNCWG